MVRLKDPAIELWGYDPYDGLNAPLFRLPGFAGFRAFNMAWIQFCKRLPLNLRPLLGVPRSANPKGLALLLLSHDLRRKAGLPGLPTGMPEEVESLLFSLKDPRYRAWGYGFPWQNRSFFFPRGLSNTVVSSFVGQALLRRLEATGDSLYLDHARDVRNFFLKDLGRSEYEGGVCLSYSAIDRSCIINTSLLAARFLADFSKVSGPDSEILELLPRLLRFAVRSQRPDGSWPYGMAANQRWVDSFHTGYNLWALHDILSLISDETAEKALQAGCVFYENHFFAQDGQAFYYADRPWPVDIHSIAQGIVTFNRLRLRFNRAEDLKAKLIQWTMERMWSEKKQSYAFQRHRCYVNRVNYNRWAQAWMHYANALEMTDAR